MTTLSKDRILDALRPIMDPEIRISVVDLGLIYDILVEDNGKVQVKMTLTTPACPYGEMLVTMVHRAIEEMDGVTGVEVILVWDPPWNAEEMCSDAAKDQLGIW